MNLSYRIIFFSAACLCLALAGCGTESGTTDYGVDQDVPFDPFVEEGASGCTPGNLYCEGTMAMTCASDGRTYENQVNCADQGKICSVGFGCTVCTPGANTCDGNVPLHCNADGTALDRLDPCPVGAQCQGGTCVSLCDQARSSNSYIGCEYWAVPTANSELSEEFEFAIAVANPQDMEASVSVSNGGGYANTFTVPANSLQSFTLPYIPSLKLVYESEASVLDPNGAYSIISTVPVTVYQFNALEYMVNQDCAYELANPLLYQIDGVCYSYTNDASLLLPQHVLTGNYYLITRPTMTMNVTAGVQSVMSNSPGFVAIAATSPNPTNVTMTFSCRTYASADGSIRAYGRGETGTFTLNQYGVLQIISDMPSTCLNPGLSESDGVRTFTYCNNGYEYDLSGTKITADQPVAVFSGHNCTFVPFERWACDHLEEQMFPLETWGKEYVVTRAIPMFTDNPEPNVWKLISGKSSNLITFDPPSVNPDITLAEGEWVEFEARDNFKIIGSEGLMIAQFMVGMNYYGIDQAAPNGDPAMCLGVPYEQYRNEYTFLAPMTYEMSWVNITIRSGAEGTILLDGMPLTVPWSLVGGSGYVTATVDVVGGSHTINASDVFGIIVYGVGDYTSYMYPGGLDLDKIFVI